MPLSLAILAPDYPPRMATEMAYFTQRLGAELSKRQVRVSIFTFHDDQYVHEKLSDHFEVHRIPNPTGPHVTVVTWALGLTVEVERILADIIHSGKNLDLIDVHGWQFVQGAVGMKKAFGLPFVATLHGLEDHRSVDLSSPLSICIRGLEWMGASESSFIITNSNWMRSEIEKVHQLPFPKIRSIAPYSPTWVEETLQIYQASTDRKISGEQDRLE